MSMIKTISLTAFSLVLAAASTQISLGLLSNKPSSGIANHSISMESNRAEATQQPTHIFILPSETKIIGPNGKQLSFDKKGEKIDALSTIFGNPTRIVDFYYEMDDMWVKKWEYPGAVFYILPDGYFDAFEIKGSGFKLNIKGAILEVGKPIDAIAVAFPNYKNYIIDGKAIAFTFKIPDGELSDEFLEIDFDPISKKILWMGNGMP